MSDPTNGKTYSENLKRQTIQFFILISRPFIDFYYNNGLTRASVLSYILCVNLVVFVYLGLTMGATIFVAPLQDPEAATRFMELHFLWPVKVKRLLQKVPPNFGASRGDLVTAQEYEDLLKKYCLKHKTVPEKIEKEQLEYVNFSITRKLGDAFHKAVGEFYNQHGNFLPGAGFFIVLAIAYIALLLNIKTNLAESVSPLIWGNLPLSSRRSQIMKILWRIPSFKTIKNRLVVFFMLPFVFILAIIVLYSGEKAIDKLIEPYTFFNTLFTALISLFITSLVFFVLYKINITGISHRNLLIGAFVAATLWMAGRWWFTSFPLNSLYKNLRNFAFIPIFLTWFYYLGVVFLFGSYVSQTCEYVNLSNTGRAWIMRDITFLQQYTTLSKWVRLDFLFRLAQNRYEEYPPPFIGIQITGDTADEIARQSYLPAHFVRECILEMITSASDIFYVEVEGNRQYCKLKLPPEEVDVRTLVTDKYHLVLMAEMEEYEFGDFLSTKYKHTWKAPALPLSEVYEDYKAYLNKKHAQIYQEHIDRTEELLP